jgi:hypothetical protein
MRRMKITLLAALVALSGTSTAIADVTYTPIHFRTISGIRPFVDVRMNGKPFLMMVHANAGFYAMTTHANATSIGVSGLVKKSNFGISSEGHVSELGRAETTLTELRVGDSKVKNVPLSVFEVPVPDMQGMLGIDWLRAERVIVDYDADRIGIALTKGDSTSADRDLIDRGYLPHKMIWDPKQGIYYVMAAVNGVPARLTVSTVSTNIIDTAYAHSAKVGVGPVVDQFDGPKGTQGDVFLSRGAVSIIIDGQATASDQLQILDTYAYNAERRPSDPSMAVQGVLGAQFMLANQAVIDFGSETLFLPKR